MRTFAARYQILRPLGEGGSGAVFLCRDATHGGEVALKLLTEPGPGMFEVLRHEFELLRTARHPRLVDVIDFGFDHREKRAFYTSRFVPGEALDVYARSKPWLELKLALTGALEALGHLHDLGLRHGDFKPANVIVSASGEATLLDLGASARVGSMELATVGTPGYLAPELAQGRVDVRSDLFAVGVVLDELVPLVKGAPTSVRTLACRLRDANPAQRPADVDEVLTLLGSEPRGRLPFIPHAFVGRDLELGIALEIVSNLERGVVPRVLLVRGAPDSGKSALVAELVAHAQPTLTVVVCDGLRADPFAPLLLEAEAPAPGDRLGIIEALDALAAREEPTLIVIDDAQALAPEDRRLLSVMVALASEKTRLGFVVAGSEIAFSEPRSVDLELGPLSPHALREWLAPRLPPELLDAVLARARGSAGRARHLASLAVTGAFGPEALSRLDAGADTSLAGLDDSKLRLLAAFVACGGRADESVLAVVGAGRRDLDLLEERGYVEPRGAGWVLSLSVSRHAIESKLGREVLREVHGAIARAHPGGRMSALPATPEEATSLADYLSHLLGAGDVAAAASRLEACEPVAERWPHAFVQIGRALDATDAPAELLARIARIELAAGDPASALRRLSSLLRSRPTTELRLAAREIAGSCYAALGNPRRARVVLSRVTAESTNPEQRACAAHALAMVYSKQGRNREAYDTAKAAIGGARGITRADLACDVAQAASYLGDVAAAREAIERAEAELAAVEGRAGTGRTRARAAAARGLAALRAGDSEAAGHAYASMLEISLAERLDDLVAFAAMNYGAVCHQSGPWAEALRAYTDGLRATRARGLASAEARCLYNLGVLHLELGQTELAEQELSQAHERAEHEKLPFVAGTALMVLGEAAARAGDRHLANERFVRAREALAACSAKRELGELDVEEAMLALAAGDGERAESQIASADHIAVELDADDLAARAGCARGLLLLANHRPHEALTALERALATAERIQHRLLCAKIAEAAARASEAAGSPAIAEHHLEHAREMWERLTLGLPPAVRELRAPARRPKPAAATAGDAADWRRIVGIYRRLNTAPTPRDVLRETLDAAIELTRAERGFLIVVENRKGERVLRAPVARNIDREALEKPQLKFSRSIAESVIETAAPLVTVDAEHDPRFSDKRSVHALQLRSVLCVPIVAASGVLGSIYLDNRFRTQGFGIGEVELVMMCADQAALALEKARLLEDLEARTHALETERQRVAALMEQQAQEIRVLSEELEKKRESGELEGIVGSTPAMRRVFSLIERAAATDISVLVTGESGTGKELVARALHQRSPRARGPFSAINCGALPEALLEAELFGYKKGAFTGASHDREGLFVAARGGTVFLDEFGEMSPAMQVKLLRVLQEREVRPLGSERTRPIDVRVVCATNRKLAEDVHAGRFREDLYYRVAVVELALPPLRERKDDLPALAATLLARISSELGRPRPRLSAGALAALSRHAWPGNVRELQNVLARAAVLGEGETIGAADLGLPGAASSRRRRGFDARAIERALLESNMNAARAAKKLGIGRATLYRWLGRAGIDRAKLRDRATS